MNLIDVYKRQSLGGTDHSIFVRQLAEGLILLAEATIPAILIDWNLANSELNAWIKEIWTFFCTYKAYPCKIVHIRCV